MENRVNKQEMGTLPFIVAVDFDGTLVRDSFPEVGKPNKEIFDMVKRWQKNGAKLVLWTCRDGERLDEAVAFCEKYDLHFDAVNRNIPEVIAMFNNDTRKVYANVYLDDKNLRPSVPLTIRGYDPKEDFHPWHSNRR